MENIENMESIDRLTRDLRNSAKDLNLNQVRYLVDLYYQIQDFRIQAGGQHRDSKDTKEPSDLIEWILVSQRKIESNIKRALDLYSDHEPTGMGVWAKSIYGIGPIASSGLLAHISLEPWKCTNQGGRNKAPCTPDNPCKHGGCGYLKIATVGQIWRFAGLDPTSKWEKKSKRPWNADLKVLCFKIGENFFKFQNRDECYYGHLYAKKKEEETALNYEGKFSDQARSILKEKEFKENTDSYKWYSGSFTIEGARAMRIELSELSQRHDIELATITNRQERSRAKGRHNKERKAVLSKYDVGCWNGVPMLPPLHIHARARRWTVKIFLYHWFAEAYRRRWQAEPPVPYVIEHLGHAHMIPAPHTDSQKAR